MATMMKVEKSLSPVRSKIYVTNKQNVQYKIFGDSINIKKYVAIVLDSSEGMGYYKLDGARTRFDVMKENAIRLIEKFKNSPETEICIFSYSDVAKETSGFMRVDGDSNAANREELARKIKGLVSENNSNLGDGMRRAYWKLKNLPMDGVKCMILMTAGEPDMFTTVSEHLYHDFETLDGNIDFITNNNASSNVYADYSSAVRYGQEMAKFIAAEKIMTFAVGFNKEESYKLEAIAAYCEIKKKADGKHYYHVEGLKDIDNVCSGVLGEIEALYPLKVLFKETMPKGVKVLSVPEGFTSTVNADGAYEISSEIQSMALNKVDDLGNLAINSWTGIVGIQYTSEGRKEFDNFEINYKDRYGNPATAEFVNRLGVDVLIDTIPPVTSCSLSGITKDSKWYSSDIQVTLTASDGIEGTDVAKIEYKLEGQDWQKYEVPFTVISEGTTKLYFRAVDNAGNVEIEKSAILNIDKTAPVVSCSLIGKKGDIDNWFVSDVQVVLTALDEPQSSNSGVSKIQYRFEDGNWLDYNAPVIATSEGVTKIFFKAVDNVGNTSAEKSVAIQIDKTGPVLTTPADLTYLASGDSVCLSTIGQATAKDLLSGVRSITNNSSMVFPVGSTAVTWTTVDGNGNKSTGVEYVTIQNPKLPGDCQYDIIRVAQSDYKIWFTANGFVPSSLRVKVKVGGAEDTINEMVLNNGVWEYQLKGIAANIDVKYSFTFTKDLTKYSTTERVYKTTSDNAIDSDYTKGVKNISASEAKIWFKANQFTAGSVKVCYSLDGAGQANVYMAKNDNWELSLTPLTNGSTIKYYFLFTKGSDVMQYKTPEYTYIHYRG